MLAFRKFLNWNATIACQRRAPGHLRRRLTPGLLRAMRHRVLRASRDLGDSLLGNHVRERSLLLGRPASCLALAWFLFGHLEVGVVLDVLVAAVVAVVVAARTAAATVVAARDAAATAFVLAFRAGTASVLLVMALGRTRIA